MFNAFVLNIRPAGATAIGDTLGWPEPDYYSAVETKSFILKLDLGDCLGLILGEFLEERPLGEISFENIVAFLGEILPLKGPLGDYLLLNYDSWFLKTFDEVGWSEYSKNYICKLFLAAFEVFLKPLFFVLTFFIHLLAEEYKANLSLGESLTFVLYFCSGTFNLKTANLGIVM